mmetsp:Transcript_26929/g.101116  ORF Transcript_26929/g.101116 Transcript_26929/m.101116 type:complete len:218 (-) Transcript_26929:577-1230(-)
MSSCSAKRDRATSSTAMFMPVPRGQQSSRAPQSSASEALPPAASALAMAALARSDAKGRAPSASSALPHPGDDTQMWSEAPPESSPVGVVLAGRACEVVPRACPAGADPAHDGRPADASEETGKDAARPSADPKRRMVASTRRLPPRSRSVVFVIVPRAMPAAVAASQDMLTAPALAACTGSAAQSRATRSGSSHGRPTSPEPDGTRTAASAWRHSL